MKLLGLTCGSPMGNTEVLVREALYAAEEAGVEIAMIKLMDLDLRPCTGCLSCVESLMKGGPGRCIQKDDFAFLDEQFMDSDGVIVGAPVYVLGPNGLLKVVADRMGPTHDVSWRIQAKLIRENTGRTAGKGPDERAFKKRVAGLISVGGATTPHWASLGLPLMHFITFPPAVQVIDQVQYLGTAAVGNFVLTPERFERAKTLGRNVAEAMLKPVEERAWKGDAEGICPVCHNDLLTVTNGRNPVECPICGIAGTLSVDGDRITVTFSEEEQARSRLTIAGKHEHWVEVSTSVQAAFDHPDRAEIPARVAAYDARPLAILAPEGAAAHNQIGG